MIFAVFVLSDSWASFSIVSDYYLIRIMCLVFFLSIFFITLKIITKDRINKVILLHIKDLVRKKNQLVISESYGLVNMSKWDKEQKKFIDLVIIKEIFLATKLFSVRKIKAFIEEAILIYERSNSIIDLYDFKSLNGYEYERVCTEILKSHGWNAHTTKGSGDQGVDIVAKKKGEMIVLQCKYFKKSTVPNSAVQEVSAGRLHYGAQFAAVVSNAVYSNSAQSLAKTNDVFLLHHDELSELEARIDARRVV